MKIYTIIVGLLFPFFISAQTITGKVTNSMNEALIGANLYWENTGQGVSTDVNGKYSITNNEVSSRLIASYIGFNSDTIDINGLSEVNFILKEANSLTEVVVKGQRDGVIISSLNPIKTEQITQTELGKAACCDLAGCFSTQSSVQPHTTNVITNSKELRILGLSGVYNQVLINGLPMIQGLSYTYGISSVPGTMVDNIYIAKGANSVLQGYESISGQINVSTKNPDNTDKVLLNVYLNSFLEKHFNANFAFDLGNDWSSLTALHSVQPANKIDKDKDNFLDLPKLTRYAVSNTFKYRDAGEWGWNSKIGVRFLNEKRVGGQIDFDPSTDKGSSEVYGQSVQLTQPEIWTKTGYRFDDISNLAFNFSTFYQDQQSYFGTTKYDAQQVSLYANAQYERNYGNHVFKTGTSLRYLDINEDIAFTNTDLPRTFDGNYHRNEVVPGVFAENAMNFFDYRLTWIAGIRADRHSEFGTFFTPRTLLKAAITPQTVIRANIGTGWRTVNLFSENIGLLVSSRDIVIEEELLPEKALNYGLNLTQKFDTYSVSGYLSADYYRTDFQNQIFPDYDADPSKAIIKNYTGTSVGNGFQAEVYARLFELVELKAGYNYLDVYRMNGETKELLPFNSKHKLLGTFSFKPKSNKYHLDLNAHWYGKQRLPNTKANPIEFQRPDYSEAYTVVGAQFTYKFKTMEWYGGCENLFDFRQEQPIASWENPFGPYFDTSSVWGPTRGREIYIGVRYYIKNKDE